MSARVQAIWRRPALALTLLACGLAVAPWALAGPQDKKKDEAMQVYYLEIVTKDVEQVCASYSAAGGVIFGKPDAGLGGARTAPMPGGGLIGVRAPLRETEAPIVRPYWLVKDIKAAVAAAQKAGGQVAIGPLEIPGHGKFAIYVQGGVDHGLWEK
jgi:predicted enzyme related to lactoylglutathione lyase